MRLGSRGSALALAQARLVADLLGGAEIITTADLADASDKSRWVRGLEDALRDGTIDLAVHSAKDVPEELPEGLSLLGATPRAAAEDVICGAAGLDALATGARVGTSSVRRAAQLLAHSEGIDVVPLAGNVDSRLRKLREGTDGIDAIVIARAGLQRLGRERETGAVLDPDEFVPAPGQGTIALEGRTHDERARDAAAAITEPDAFACLRAERAVSHALGTSCHTPIGAYATIGGELVLRAWVGLPDGSAWVRDELGGDPAESEELGRAVAARMRSAGAAELLRAAEEMTVGER